MNQVDWNCSKYGKLWTYNLNYFDFLNQKDMSKELGLDLVHKYVKNDSILKDGKEPYPTSLRSINWIKFLSKHKIQNDYINKFLFRECNFLYNNLEYHLLGNHLLENAFSLLFCAYYFQDENIYIKSKDLLILELNEQILKDGAHFELSTMYHQIIYSRLLDCIQLIKLNSFWKKDDLLSFLVIKASLMNSWLQNITYKSGEIPMVNDSTYNIAPSSTQLFSYAKKIGIINQKTSLSDSGYRKITSDCYELFVDVGNVGPDYQPGHGHSDTFSFELIKDGNPIFVDTGISTYKKNNTRQEERSTHSHNTVKIGSKDQTQVWGGFRVGKRARINHLAEKLNCIEASHDGYLNIGLIHKRSFFWEEKEIIIIDKISKPTNNISKAFFHFHSSINLSQIDNNTVVIDSLGIVINFEKASNIFIDKYKLSQGFNKSVMSYKIVVKFDDYLKTSIHFH
ncbi:heparinase II/III family protein [Flavobacteriales bacterium]|nr:heparinase II/III family protein [Flavobacteriales bacterium]